MSFCQFIYYDFYKKPYIFMDQNQVESKILKTQQHEPPLYFGYIDDIFLSGLNGREKLEEFLDNLYILS